MENNLTLPEEELIQIIRQNYIGFINEFLDYDIDELNEIENPKSKIRNQNDALA